MRSVLPLLLLAACAATPEPGVLSMPGPCEVVRAEVGELPSDLQRWAAERALLARRTADAGHTLLASQALSCARELDLLESDGLLLHGQLQLEMHRFAAAERVAATMVASRGERADHLLLSDALMEQGKLQQALTALDAAEGGRPDARTLDRRAWLLWQSGDLDGAITLERQAVAHPGSSPEDMAWYLTQLGMLTALTGGGTGPFDAALQIVPGYRHALLQRGLVRLHRGEAGAEQDLRAVGDTVAAAIALRELDPSTDVRRIGIEDPRGYAMWLAPSDPDRALVLMDRELAQRQDALTLMAHAFVRHHGGQDATDAAAAALATGSVDPQVLWMGALILQDPDLLARARAWQAGLRPSQLEVRL